MQSQAPRLPRGAAAPASRVARGTTGQLWRFDLTDRSVTQVETASTDLINVDGLVRRGGRLTVVRNFPRVVTTLRLAADGTSAWLVSERTSDPDRVLTTARALRGRILYVDSHFDEPVASPSYKVLTDPFDRDRAHQGHWGPDEPEQADPFGGQRRCRRCHDGMRCGRAGVRRRFGSANALRGLGRSRRRPGAEEQAHGDAYDPQRGRADCAR